MRGVEGVLTTVNITAAIIGGLLVGWFLIGTMAADPAWISPVATARGVAMLVAGYSIAVGLVFFLGQTVGSFVDGDPNWPRVFSRYVVMVIFDLAMGGAVYVRLRNHESRKHRDAMRAAESKIARRIR